MQAQAGEGQVVLLSGEPGIGKSRLVQELKERVTQEGATPLAFQCSPYHQNSALHPIIEHWQQLLQFTADDTPEAKLARLQQQLGRYRFPQADTLPLLAVFLSLPHPKGVPPLTVSPQKQKELTQAALVAWLIEETEQHPVYLLWEDLHWVDPSTLEVLGLLLNQVPTTRLLVVLTFRPEFAHAWGTHSYLSHITLSRLGYPYISAMVERVTSGKALPAEVLEQIITKTDGVPLFVEELTKIVIESGIVQVVNSHYELTGPLSALAIPSTLQDSLMARLDRLPTAKEVAQLGATIGREFSYELLQAVAPFDEEHLQHQLKQLVEAELVYQRGVPPQAQYLFKHALIQDAAYQSLLKSRRRQVHQQIAQVLEAQFSETLETQPELVAHHYTEGGSVAQALPYWQRAGQRAFQHSANAEAESHLTKALELLKILPTTPERDQQELTLHVALWSALMATKGMSAPEMESVLARAHELCRKAGETPQLLSVLTGLWTLNNLRLELKTARELAEQLLRLAQSLQNSRSLIMAHHAMGCTLYYLGEVIAAQAHQEQGLALYDPQRHSPQASGTALDNGITCLIYIAAGLWDFGHPDQALEKSQKAFALAQELSHPLSLAYALNGVAGIYKRRWEAQKAQEWAETTITLCNEQGFPQFLAYGLSIRGWALAEQGHLEEGIHQMRQGLATLQETGQKSAQPLYIPALAAAYGTAGQVEKGLSLLTEALAMLDKSGGRSPAAELYRLKGDLICLTTGNRPRATVEAEAEECFLKAIEMARQHRAKSLELRAAVSLSRLWQRQGKKAEAHQLLSEIYDWFTEGFDTTDLQEAKTLLDELD